MKPTGYSFLLALIYVVSLASARPNYFQNNAGGEDAEKTVHSVSPGITESKTAEEDGEAKDIIPILRDERVNGEDGSYSVDIETGNGIIISESGAPNGPEGSFTQQGTIKFDFPTGETYEMKYVANENGFQPESPLLPVAPEFPHPIPDFVLEQIERAKVEDEEASKEGNQEEDGEAEAGTAVTLVEEGTDKAENTIQNGAPSVSYGFP